MGFSFSVFRCPPLPQMSKNSATACRIWAAMTFSFQDSCRKDLVTSPWSLRWAVFERAFCVEETCSDKLLVPSKGYPRYTALDGGSFEEKRKG